MSENKFSGPTKSSSEAPKFRGISVEKILKFLRKSFDFLLVSKQHLVGPISPGSHCAPPKFFILRKNTIFKNFIENGWGEEYDQKQSGRGEQGY